MIRGIVLSIAEGVIKRFTASGRSDETISDREYFQHYGYTSRPKAGAEIIIIREGGHFIAVASDDRRYRIAMEDGEVALYDDLGQKVHLTRAGINVVSPLAITATAPAVTIVGSESITLDSPLVTCTGNLQVDGGITATAGVTGATVSALTSVTDSTGTMAAMRATYNSHVHGTGPTTTQVM